MYVCGLVIPVPESAVSRIHVGNAIAVTVQSLHKTVTGKIARCHSALRP